MFHSALFSSISSIDRIAYEWTAGADDVSGLNAWNVRWVGPDGYTGKAAKAQRQKFRHDQQDKSREPAS